MVKCTYLLVLQLSFAMSMLGQQTMMFLDEPSTGMDPRSRRLYWSVSSGGAGPKGGEVEGEGGTQLVSMAAKASVARRILVDDLAIIKH